jgi:hypothetical protein
VNYFPGDTSPAYAKCYAHAHFLPQAMNAPEPTLLDHARTYRWVRESVRLPVWYRVKYADPNVEIPLRHADQYRQNLRSLATICKACGVRVVFGRQAYYSDRLLLEKHLTSKSFSPEIEYPEPAQLHEHFQAYLQIVSEVARREKAPCADPYAILKDHEELFADHVHLHASGARVVAEEFARCLMDSGLFSELVMTKRQNVE